MTEAAEACRMCNRTGGIDHGAEYFGAREFPDSVCEDCYRMRHPWDLRWIWEFGSRAGLCVIPRGWTYDGSISGDSDCRRMYP